MGQDFIEIDGSFGEGGGQILRTSLSLSLITGKPFKIYNIRSRRRKPGLKRQHLTAVQAAGKIGGAKQEGGKLNSQTLSFAPQKLQGGEFSFAVGTAGSSTLILQTLLPALLFSDKPSVVKIEGGTHNPLAPPFDYLKKVFLPQLAKMAAKVELKLERYGFFPAGGGAIVCHIDPWTKKQALSLVERGDRLSISAQAIVAQLPEKIAWRELDKIDSILHLENYNLHMQKTDDSTSPGNIVFVETRYENVTEMFTGFGVIGVRAEKVGHNTAKLAKKYLESAAPVGEYLADQLLLPMALGKGGKFRTGPLSQHSLTNIEVIKKFLPVEILALKQNDDTIVVEVNT